MTNSAKNRVQEITIRGKAMYAKILGEPVLNYNKDGKEWKLDIELTPSAVKDVKSVGVGDRIKQKENYLDGEPYLSLKQAELRKDGQPNKPITVVDAQNKPWDQEKLIGNGSVIDLKIAVIDYGPGKKAGMYPRAVRVLDHVPYAGAAFEALDEDDEYFAGGVTAGEPSLAEEPKEEPKKGRSKKPVFDEDLDDEIPF